MIGLFMSVVALASTWHLSRKSLGAGCVAMLAWGYHYAFLRAHIYDSGAHFIFDAATIGLYLGCLTQPLPPDAQGRTSRVKPWVYLLMGWPVIWVAMPFQHPLIQLVGLRAAIFFVPCLLVGARADGSDLRTLARGLAALNLAALGFGAAQYVFGLEAVMPLNAVTANMYRANDVAGYSYHRITASFVSSHSYGGAMLGSVPFLFARMLSREVRSGERILLYAGMLAAGLGIFACGARSPVVLLFLMLAMMLLTGGLGWRLVAPLLVGGAGVTYAVLSSERFQRFTSLENTEYVSHRLGSSVNQNFFQTIAEHPIGEGLGSAYGTSIPHFLQHLKTNHYGHEMEYARLFIELGPVGLLLWVAFIIRTLVTRQDPATFPSAPRITSYGRFYVALMWATGMIGTGLLTSIPTTALLLFLMGLLMRWQPEAATSASPSMDRRAAPAPRFGPTGART